MLARVVGFPGFDPAKRKILFFSRGAGRGHAVPDVEIAREIEALRSDIEIRFASYATGARTLEALGCPLIDLALPELNAIAETTVATGQVIGMLNPDLVVAHEEFAALPVAAIFSKPVALITDWFTDPRRYSMETLRYAHLVVFIGDPGVFEEPDVVRGRVAYTGPVLRRFEYTRKDRARARRELDLPSGALVAAVLPGSWTEEMFPVADLILAAFELLPADRRRLVWIAGEDAVALSSREGGRSDIRVGAHDWKMDRLMSAIDVAITKSTRKTLAELDHLGVRSVSLLNPHNPIDNRRAAHYPLNRVVDPAATDATALAQAILEAARAPRRPARRDRGGAAAAAELIIALLDAKVPAAG